MQGATTDDEPMGRNPGTSEAANLTALKVRGCDLAPRFADLIEASGHVPCFKAVHMNAPSTRVKSIEKLLAPRAVPHMRGGFKWSSQHLDGSCDEHSKTALGSFWAGALVLTRSTAGGRARGAAAILGSDCGGHGE